MRQNITLSLEKDIIKKARVLAAQQETSLSRMLGDELKRLVLKKEEYRRAKRRSLAILKKGFRFGGKITASRESWHDRQDLR